MVLACLMLSSVSYAQNSTEVSDEELVVDRPSIPDAPNSRSSDRGSSNSQSNDDSGEQVFKPTEEISEDSAVAFPVDI